MKAKKKSVWWKVLVLLVLVLVGGGGWYYFYGRPKPLMTMTVPVHKGHVEKTVLASGTVKAENLVSVGAQVSGRLESLKVALGDTVKAGQLIAEIDSLTQQNDLRTEKAALASVQAERVSKEASLHEAQLAYDRQKKMLKGDAASQEDYESAEADLNVLKAELVQIDAEIEQAKIAVDTAKLDLGYTKIVSPIDGVVVAVVTKEGQTVNASQEAPTIVKVAQLDRMQIKVEISEADVIKVKPGQRVSFTILGDPDTKYPATLQSIEPAPESIADDDDDSSSSSDSDEAIYYMGILDVPNPEGKLRISMTAQVNIVLGEVNDVLVIPAAALDEKGPDGKYMVQVETAPGQIEMRHVTAGLNDNVTVQIIDGLKLGDNVVIGEQKKGTADAGSSDSNHFHGPPPGMM